MLACDGSRRGHDPRGRADRPRPRLVPRLGDPGAAKRSPTASTRSSPTSARSWRRARRSTTSSTTSTSNLDAGVDLLEGLLVKKAGLTDAVGLVEGLYAGPPPPASGTSRRARRSTAPRIGEVYTQGHAHARPARPRGADRRREPRRSRTAGRRARQPGRAAALPGDPPDEARVAAQVAGDRHRRARAVRAARRHRGTAQAAPDRTPGREELCCRPLRHSSTSARPASRARSRRCRGSAPRRASSRAGTACCR